MRHVSHPEIFKDVQPEGAVMGVCAKQVKEYVYIFHLRPPYLTIPGTIEHPNNLVRHPHELTTSLSALRLVLGVVS